MIDKFIWSEKYRPNTIDQIILPERIKQIFTSFCTSGEVPNLLLSGPPGCGKTTVARALLEQLGHGYIIINGSLDGNIDTLRTQIKDYASSVSFNRKRKYVIIDEADYLTHAVQPALRGFIDEHSSNCGFIFTCNYKQRIIDPLQSRLSSIEFNFTQQDKLDIAKQLFQSICQILDTERVQYDKKVIAELIKVDMMQKSGFDIRHMINLLQQYSRSGSINSGILTYDTNQLSHVVKLLKDKDFTGIRKWCQQAPVSDIEIYSQLYDQCSNFVEHESIPPLVLILAKYQAQAPQCANRELNLAACLLECMIDVQFK